MKDSTRIRRLTKLYVAMNAREISLIDATVALRKLLPDKKLRDKLWMEFNGMTDLGRKRWRKEITQ